MIDSIDGRNVFLARADSTLLSVLRLGYRVFLLGDAGSPSLLWADSREGANPATVTANLRARRITSSGSAEFGTWLSADGPACYHLYSAVVSRIAEGCPAFEKFQKAGISGGNIRMRESMVWQVLPGENRIRTFRSNDGGELVSTVFQPLPRQPLAQVTGAAEFGDYWLVEWQSGTRRWFALHRRSSGEPITDALRSPFANATLLESVSHPGLRFLRWHGDTPVEVITATASIEWTRKPE